MQIKFPYIYEADVVMGRKRTPEVLSFLGFLSVDVPEVSEADAPEAVIWEEREGQPNHARFFDGKFYVPASTLQWDKSKLRAEMMVEHGSIPEEAARSVAAMMGYVIGTPSWHAMISAFDRVISRMPLPSISDAKTISMTNEEKCREKAEIVAQGLLSIDGILYRNIPEPVIIANLTNRNDVEIELRVHLETRRYGSPINIVDTRSIHEVEYVSDPGATKFFALADLKGAEDWLSNCQIPTKKCFHGDINVRMPEVFIFDQAFESVIQTAEFVVEGLKPKIGNFDRQTIEAWLNVRDDIRSWQETNNPAIIETLAATGLPLFLESLGSQDNHAAASIEEGLGLWDDGPICGPLPVIGFAR